MNSLNRLLVRTWLRHRRGHVILCVSARLQFHTELSTVSVSAEISFVFALTCKWTTHFVTLCWGEKRWIRGQKKKKKWNRIKMPRLWSEDILPSSALIIPLHLPPVVKLHRALFSTVLLKFSKWLSEGLGSCCMLMSSALHRGINTKAPSKNRFQSSALCAVHAFYNCPKFFVQFIK